MIKLVNFSKKYSSKSEFAVKDISFWAKNGVTGLLGLNGAGKSTIIKAITCQHFPTQGTILVSDENGIYYDVSTQSDIVRKHIGYVPENQQLPLKLTVAEYLKFTMDLYSVPKNQQALYFEETINKCQLEDVLSSKIGTLSKGFKQRVSLAQALIYKPGNLILDEVVNGLDPAQIIQFRDIIKVQSQERTVLISTHLMQEVKALCSEIHILSKGKISASGTEQEILSLTAQDDIEKAFLKLTGSENERKL